MKHPSGLLFEGGPHDLLKLESQTTKAKIGEVIKIF